MSDTNEPPDPPPIEAPQGAASQENTATSSYATALKVPAQPDVYAQQNKLQECAIGEDASATTAQRHAIRQKDAMIGDKRADIRALHVELRDKEAEFKSKLEVAKQAKEEAEAAAERAASQIEDLQNELNELKAQLRTAEDKAFQAQKEHDKQLDNRLKDVEVLCSN
jgi:chromosome segregation ATPase